MRPGCYQSPPFTPTPSEVATHAGVPHGKRRARAPMLCGRNGCSKAAYHSGACCVTILTTPRKRREAWRDPAVEVARFAACVAALDPEDPVPDAPTEQLPAECGEAIALLMSDAPLPF